jgi:hypothetical protein
MRTWTTEDRAYYEQHLRQAIAALNEASWAIWTIVRTDRLWEGTATPGHNEDEPEALRDVLAEIEGMEGGFQWIGQGRHEWVMDILILLLHGGVPCSACGECTVPASGEIELYTLRDDLEATISAGSKALCIGCAEERLGRRLEPADFVDLDAQRRWAAEHEGSARLLDRLSVGANGQLDMDGALAHSTASASL